jgi:hypothetical protein
VRIVMLAGDSQRTADAVARQLGIDEGIGEVLPEEKAKHVQRLQSQGHKVAMAGDGINECCSGYLRQTARQIFRWSMARQSNWKSTGFAKQFSQPHSVARRHQSAWLPFPLSTMIYIWTCRAVLVHEVDYGKPIRLRSSPQNSISSAPMRRHGGTGGGRRVLPGRRSRAGLAGRVEKAKRRAQSTRNEDGLFDIEQFPGKRQGA